jgi:hypothetical protein
MKPGVGVAVRAIVKGSIVVALLQGALGGLIFLDSGNRASALGRSDGITDTPQTAPD